MQWETDTPERTITERSTLNCGPVRLSVKMYEGDPRTWQHFLLSFAEPSEGSPELRRMEWPREALRMARAELDAFEASLEE